MKDEIFSSLTAHFKKTVNSDSAGWDMGIACSVASDSLRPYGP